MEIPSKFDSKGIESKWYAYWQENNFFKSIPDDREPYTIVIPPPNVTGVLHMGHMLNNSLQDIIIRRARQYGMRGANLIPVNMYGPHDHFNLTSSHVIPALILKVYAALKNGENEINIWGTGQASREFLYAPDCAEAIALAIQKDVSLDPINIGTGCEIKISDLVTEIVDQMRYTGWITYDESKPDGQPRRCLNTWSAEEKLGFRAKTNLQTGLKQTIKWFLNDDNWKENT